MPQSTSASLPDTTTRPVAPEMRIVALDGFRGLTTLMVVVSHYFAELNHGVAGLAFGWIAVLCFFVLSGFLIGRLILEKQVHANFFSVFYVRRVCRMMPPFLVVLAAIFGLYAFVGHHHWAEIKPMFPLWSYLTFTQGFLMVSTDSIGPHWLAPTWTLAVEEHFYLIAPATIIFTPRRHLLKALVAVALASVALRLAIFQYGVAPEMVGRVMIISLADTLIAGIIAAELYVTRRIDWARHGEAIRIAPIVLLALALATRVIDDRGNGMFSIFGTLFIAIAAACLILSLMYGAPEAKRFENKTLCFFGHTSYTIYLTHLAVLGMMHGLILGDIPDLATWQQLVVTLAALPVAGVVGWVLFKFVEEPFSAYGRTWRWSKEQRAVAGGAVARSSSVAGA